MTERLLGFITSNQKHLGNLLISYSQNFEDVLLNRIFSENAGGFYVDIGACHPVYDSVTKYFSTIGWNGINVEPIPELLAEIEQDRPQDKNLQLVIAESAGKKTLHITSSLANSTIREDYAEIYNEESLVERQLEVDAISLTDLWINYVQTCVHFLKIDVEGAESMVLRGANFDIVDPLIMLIESTVPQHKTPSHNEWESEILDHYDFIYFDGLNRYYRRKSFDFDLSVLSTPVNVFDDYIRYAEYKASKDILELQKEIRILRDESTVFQSRISSLERDLVDKDKAEANARMRCKELESALSIKEQDNSTINEYNSKKVATQQEELDSLREAVNDKSKKIEEIEVYVLDLEKTIDRKNKELSELISLIKPA